MKLPAGLAWVSFASPSQLKEKLKTRPSAKQPGTGISPFRSSRRRLSQFTLRLNGRAGCGIAKLATLSDGTVFEPVNSFKTNQTKLARLQRQLSKR